MTNREAAPLLLPDGTVQPCYAHDVPASVPLVDGRPPQGWDGLGRCVAVARAHPTWTADQVERRALAMHVCGAHDADELAARLRRVP